LGYTARKRLDAQVPKNAFPGRQVFFQTHPSLSRMLAPKENAKKSSPLFKRPRLSAVYYSVTGKNPKTPHTIHYLPNKISSP
jgi:hypothetical protein